MFNERDSFMEPRSRNDGHWARSDLVNHYTYNPIDGPTIETSWTTLLADLSGDQERAMSGFDIPNFHKRKRAGELLPHTPFEYQELFGKVISGEIDFTNSHGNRAFGSWTELPVRENDLGGRDYFVTAAVANGFDEELDYEYDVQRAAAAISSSGFDALTFLAELSDLKSLFKSVLTRLKNARLPKGAKDLSDAWLEWRYGWRTLLFDLEEINDLLTKLNETALIRYSETKSSLRVNTQVHNLDYSSRMSGECRYTGTLTEITRLGTRGSVDADIIVDLLQFNVPKTAWELTKFSFLFDWLVNVGQTIDALTFLSSQTQYVASGGTFVEVTYVTSAKPVAINGALHASGHSGAVTTVRRSKRVPTTIPVVPQFRVNIDAFKSLDLIALIRQRFK